THNRPTGKGLPLREVGTHERALRSARGGGARRTTIIVTHDRELLRRFSPRVVMLHQAGICFDGPYVRFGGPDCPPAEAYLAQMPVLHARDGRRWPDQPPEPGFPSRR